MIKKRINYTEINLKNKKKTLIIFEGIYNCNLWNYLLISKSNDKTCASKIVNQNIYIDSLKLKIINKGTSLWW